jgi:hypothetical protein
VRVGAGVEEQASNAGDRCENNSTNDDESNCPTFQQGRNNQYTLLCSVGEVVVACTHEIESTRFGHFYQSAIKYGPALLSFMQLFGS